MKNKKEGVSWTLTHPLFISYSFLHFFISSFHFFISFLICHFSFLILSSFSFVITNLGFHELLGSSELVSHHAQEFLTLLEDVEINQ